MLERSSNASFDVKAWCVAQPIQETLHAVSFVFNGFHLTYEEKLDDVRKLDRVQEVPACGRINKGDLRMRCAIIS